MTAVVLLALLFAFATGAQDAARSISPVVSTGALRPQQAVLWAAGFNLAAVLLFELGVARFVATGLVDPLRADRALVLGALLGALTWIVAAWMHAMPASPTHALIGGLVGAALTQTGTDPVSGANLLKLMVLALVAPLAAVLATGLLLALVSRIAFRAPPRMAARNIRRLQLLTAAACSLGHGGNSAQKALGVIWLASIGAGVTSAERIGGWMTAGCYAAIALGTLVGGLQAVRRMAQRFTRLDPAAGLCVDAGAAAVLAGANAIGMPVSTTHLLAGAMIGAGSTRHGRAVDWKGARATFFAWVATLCASAALAALASTALRRFG